MHHIYHLDGKKKYFALIFVVLVYGLLFYFFSETFKYFVRNNYPADLAEEYRDLPITVGCIAGLALLVGTGSIYFYRKVDVEKNLIAVKGAVPGPKGGIVFVRSTVK